MTEQRISMIEFYERLPVAVYICGRYDVLVDYKTAAAALFPVAPPNWCQGLVPQFSNP